MGTPALTEEHLCHVWAHRLYHPQLLTTDRGELVHVVFPGRRSGDPGPDFRDAVLALPEATLLRGDVEIHLEGAGWMRHGHAADPRYANVILHVTWEESRPVKTSRGETIRTLALALCVALTPEDLLAVPLRHSWHVPPSCPASAAAQRLDELSALIHDLGQQRLLERAQRLAADAAVIGFEQAVWQRLLRALGYHRNTDPFAHLAEAVPWSTATALLALSSGEEGLQALLLGSAGFFTEEAAPWTRFDSGELNRWRPLWKTYRRWLAAPPLRVTDWTFSAVRPENTPSRRILAAAAIAARWAPVLTEALVDLVRGTDRRIRLTDRRRGRGRAAPLGMSREEDLVVNVVLPLALAVAMDERDPTLEERVWDRFATLSRSAGNSITRHMRATIGLPQHWELAPRAEQGLLYVHERWCRERYCSECPLGQRFGTPVDP
ncbi:MAG: DUF2851 family protein [Chloroflexi bacterium]|nr:DUF2851 family protein [Chloroflexota bacterium]